MSDTDPTSLKRRESDLRAFLSRCGWADATRTPLQGDASTRHYERLSLGETKALLMNAPQATETPSAPPNASVEDRIALGYTARARLAGNNVVAFSALAEALTSRGFSAPNIMAADVAHGFLLLEDLGSALFAKVIKANLAQETPLYETAIDTLAAIYRCSFPPTLSYHGHEWTVQSYDTHALLAENDLCLDWYAKDLGYTVSEDAREEWAGLWRDAFKSLEAHADGLCLRDYHAENLFWLPERQATAKVGLIDFQDALFVHPAYDLVSCLEDARRDVSLDLHEPLKQRFCDKAGLKYDADFKAAYAVMGAQRNTKVIGFPVRADLLYGKPQYRALIPRVRAHLNRDLAHPILAPIKNWYARVIPDILD